MRELFFYALIMGLLASAGDPPPDAKLAEQPAVFVEQSPGGRVSDGAVITKF